MLSAPVTRNSREKDFSTNSGVSGKAILSFDADGFMAEFDDDVTLNRYSPVLQKRIGSEYQNNVSIRGKFRTSFNSEDTTTSSGFSFIQVGKNTSGFASAYSGYGVAWRTSIPNSQHLVGIVSAPQNMELGAGYYDITPDGGYEGDRDVIFLRTTIDGKAVYVPMQYVSYTGGVYIGCYCPGISPSILTDTLCVSPPNIYIVDSDPFNGDTYGTNYVSDPLSGLSYIAAASALIEPNTEYYFELVITQDNAISFKIGDTPETVLEVIKSGATTTLVEYLGTENADAFGLSVYDTSGAQWWYDNISISKLSGEYAVGYFEFSTLDMPEDLQVELSAKAEDSDADGLVVTAWNPLSNTWDVILSAYLADITPLVTNSIARSVYEYAGKIVIRITTAAPSDIGDPSLIEIEYIRIVSAYLPGMHIGGCVDVYVDDPVASISTITITIGAGGVLSESVGAVPNIMGIYIGETELAYAKDYVIYENNPSMANSIYAEPQIRLREEYIGMECVIHYWESSILASIQAMMESDEYRPLGTSVLVKHKQIHEVRTSPVEAGIYVGAYLDGLMYEGGVKTISYAELYRYIYAETGSYMDVTLTIKTMSRGIIAQRTLNALGQEYAIDEIETLRTI